jgi:eukaryotic-like serine/threonine-protein kinase
VASPPLHPGMVVDGWRIDGCLRDGGMARLYRVSGRSIGIPLLMKVPKLGPGEPASTLVSFEVEQMILEVLSGSHVPRFVGKGEVAGEPYLVMELVEGKTLESWVDRAPVEAAEVARLGAATATAAHAIHLQDAIHLDLKPANVMIRPDGSAVLLDFGLARHAHFPDLLAEEYRRPIGSAPYVSPEQVAGGRSDPRSDLFALGVTLYELATGLLPFGIPHGSSALRQRLWMDPEPPRALVPALPEWLQEVILHCLEVDARARPQSAAQVVFALAHPDQVAITARGRRLATAGTFTRLRRWYRAISYQPPLVPRPSTTVARGSIALVAIATTHVDEAQLQALRETSRRLFAGGAYGRLAVVTVVRPSAELGAEGAAEDASRLRMKHLAVLRHWAEPLQLPPGRISFHVLEGTDPAEELLLYARANHVDHIVIGAPPRDVPMRGMLGAVSTAVSPDAAPEPLSFLRLMGAVSTKVAAEAPCTVTVVRPRR